MGHVSKYAKQRILELYFDLSTTNSQYVYGPVSKRLEQEGIQVGRKTVRDIIIRYKASSTLKRKDGSGRRNKATDRDVLLKIETYLKANNEASTSEVRNYLSRFGYNLSLTTVRRAKAFLGWSFKVPGYCQLIRDVNKTKRLAWAQANIDETFDNVVFTDETSVWLEKHKKRCYHKKGYFKRAKPRAKYPVKVHVWAGISKNGATKACIFEGNMDAQMYTEILKQTLIPFVKSSGTRYRFMQDNDPKHTSKQVQNFMTENSINWWKTPPESPDINPIEMVWHELKEYIRGVCKPNVKEELIQGITEFWKTMTVAKCQKYIGHLKRVIPRIIEVKGRASGY